MVVLSGRPQSKYGGQQDTRDLLGQKAMDHAKQQELTDRQVREIEYHKLHVQLFRSDVYKYISHDIIEDRKRRWWDGHWTMYTWLLKENLRNRKVLIAGCGFGFDALQFAKMGADTYAFDISPDMLNLAVEIAERENLSVRFQEMPIEALQYEDDFFDYVIARDIFHHVDIPLALSETIRVSKPGAYLIVYEVYTHSVLQRIRKSQIVERFLYPRMKRFIHKTENPYITEDEKKLTEDDVRRVKMNLSEVQVKYFNFTANRLFPDRWLCVSKIDSLFTSICKPIAPLLCGRVLLKGKVL